MLLRFSTMSMKMCCGCLLLALTGCGRTAVVVAPDGAPPADSSPLTPHAARGKGEDSAAARTAFAFPEDRGGALLARVLPPRQTQAAQADRTRGPHPFPPPASVRAPSLPLPASPSVLPRLPDQRKPGLVQPRLVIEETLGGWDAPPVLPEVPSLPAGERMRLPSPDVNQPLPLPLLAQPVLDRAPLDDATVEASTAAALAAPPPQRLNMAPFLKLTLPDPFEHRRPLTIPAPPEEADPVMGTSPLPESRPARTPGR